MLDQVIDGQKGKDGKPEHRDERPSDNLLGAHLAHVKHRLFPRNTKQIDNIEDEVDHMKLLMCHIGDQTLSEYIKNRQQQVEHNHVAQDYSPTQ